MTWRLCKLYFDDDTTLAMSIFITESLIIYRRKLVIAEVAIKLWYSRNTLVRLYFNI